MGIFEVLLTMLCGAILALFVSKLHQKASRQSDLQAIHESEATRNTKLSSSIDCDGTIKNSQLKSAPSGDHYDPVGSNARQPSISHDVYRVRAPLNSDLQQLQEKCLGADCEVRIHSLVLESTEAVATVSFNLVPGQLLDGLDEWTFAEADMTIDRHFRGLTTLYSPDSLHHLIDIIAVCGLGGHAFGSFKERGGPHMWLRDALPRDFPEARIMIYGYDSHIYRSTSFQDLESIAGSLRICIEGMQTSSTFLQPKPIIFIAHSLGGLVLKEALIQSGKAKSQLIQSTYSALFFGVPNRGMDIASLLPMSKNQPNEAFLHTLHPESELLRKQSREFPEIFNSRNTKIYCFYETSTSPTAVQVNGKWKMQGSPAILVGSVSATHCRPWEDQAHHIQGLNRSHSELVKYRRRDDDYDKVRTIIKMIGWPSVRSWRQTIAAADDDKLTDEFLKALLVTKPADEMNRIENAKDSLLKECYWWIMSDQQLHEWQDDPDCRLLWMSGDPGKGKTMLMISLHGPHLNTATSVLRGILWTLVDGYPSLGKYFRQEYRHGGKQFCEGPNAFFTLSTILSTILRDVKLPTIYILVDALDECDNGRKQLLEFIRDNAADDSSKAKWLVSSRNHVDIKEHLRPAKHGRMLSLELNATHIEQSVNAFINYKISKLASQKGYDKILQLAIKSYLVEMANSTFLWVALVCKRLEEVSRRKTLAELQAFPPGLQPLYGRMLDQLQNLDEEDKGFTAAILRSSVLARRLLILEELAILAELPEDLLDDEQALLELVNLCGSFIISRERTTYFIHQSAKDYFVTGNGQRIFPSGMGQEHGVVVHRSLNVMRKILRTNICSLPALDSSASEAIIGQHLKCIGYVCCFWVYHLENYLGNAVSDCTCQELLYDDGKVHQFFLESFLNWIETLGLIGEVHSGILALEHLRQLIYGVSNPNLGAIVHDATRIILQCRLAVEQAPLQIYSSGLIFAPTQSLIRQRYEDNIPRWIDLNPGVPTYWSPCLQTLEGHTDCISSVVFSPDGRCLASSSSDHTVRIWDSKSGALQHTLEGHTKGVYSVVFTPNDQQLASSSSYHTIRIWDSKPSRLMRNSNSFDNRELTPASIYWHPNNDGIISAETLSVNENKRWITWNGRRVLWLPPAYRPVVVTSHDQTIAIGCLSGLIFLVRFNFEE